MSLVGARVLRKEDPRLLSGTGTFVDDLAPAHCTFATFVASSEAHARIVSIDVREALRLEGVLAVFTAADFAEYPALPGGMADLERPALAGNVVRFVGEPLAVVVAEDRYIAADAADAIVVEYEPLPPVATIAAATAAGAPVLFPAHGSNVATVVPMIDDLERQLERCDGRANLHLVNQRCAAVPIEPMACLADWRRDGLTLWATFQAPHHLRNYLASWLDIAQTDCRVIAPDVGGGFGSKIVWYPELFLAPVLSKRVAAPREVRPDPHRGDAPDEPRARPGARHRRGLRQGRPDPRPAARRDPEPRRLPRPDRPRSARADHVDGRRRLPHRRRRHVVPHGRDEHDAGRRLPRRRPPGGGVLDRADRRRRRQAHRHRPGRGPAAQLRAAVGVPVRDPQRRCRLRLRRLPEGVGRVPAAARLRRRARRAGARGRDDPSQPLLGIGLSCWLEIAGFGPNGSLEGFGHLASWESAQVRVQPDGSAIVFAGSSPHGQGHETVFAQIAADELGIAFDRIQVRTGDTATVLQGIGTMGSRGVPTSGSAVKVASARVLERAKRDRRPPARGQRARPRGGRRGVQRSRVAGQEGVVG